jgi:hypothetical protein
MMTTDIADALTHFEWDTLRSFCGQSANLARASGDVVQQLLKADLLALQGDRPAITAKGRKVVVCGSPRLWHS